ncbi:MAG TPA: geopeptide radical SAM maturase, partial [Thermodesulfovibrionales bacterium]|nr:geopeptide radical SAM maturase [Thermodesulfovibrionales bacterium]
RETADDFTEFVTNKIGSERSFDEVHITFYGGEPLLSKELIVYVSGKVKALAERTGISFSSSLMTNGTLLTKDAAKELKALGLKDVYITVDGLKTAHDRSRPFKGGSGSFDTIVGNILDGAGTIDILVGGNYTRSNFREFPALLDYVYKKGLTPSLLSSVAFYPVVSESGEYAMPDFHEGCISANEPWLVDASLFLREEILKRGYCTDRITPGICMMEFGNNILVDYEGSIYKCPGLIGRTNYKIGHIRTGINDYRLSHNLNNWKNEECLDCSYLPLCFGGCRYMKLVRDGDMNGVDCKKPYFDAALESLVRQDIRFNLSG